ncbi:trehalose-6-phosphate synthase [Calidifontibacter sp. DB0510]|uniref:Trehalose-6-phosphate synthase n=1 Tax=Metallococcus carri TaxID=1656884 RepID=A0A967EEC8_9MICO|nr:trehalose-6-phosphate synthase [Metallococcus carri]NHN55546.1 trehalose-6-phosphate synthase [Metallococcus carri]NOP38270.1 trehalose-6-phosphate synthase [Calidifontibacter sp. DB2511S]
MPDRTSFDLVIVANRLPVDRVTGPDGRVELRRSPGGLVTAMESVMRGREGAWVGWAGEAGEASDPFVEDDMYLVPVPLSADEVADYYEGYSNASLWPIYHDVIVQPVFKRRWRSAYEKVNRRFAEAAADCAARGATVWVHDYQLQLAPHILRELRPDLRIGWFNHIPFPPVELFMQLPRREELLRGLLGADFLGFQRRTDAENFRSACRRLLGATVKGEIVTTEDGRAVRAAAVPISIDADGLQQLARSEPVQERAREIRHELGDPDLVLLGVDRLDYTKGIRHRLKAFGELLSEGTLTAPGDVLIQVATPSRERLEAYQTLRGQVERTVGQINGDYAPIGTPAVSYLHRSFPREEMAALFVAADVMLVTPLRDGMNLVAKEYVTCHGDDGALVLSEFTGAAVELQGAYRCNPHDIDALKTTIMEAARSPLDERRRRMRSMRRQVASHDVARWAQDFLDDLAAAPDKPERR